MTDVSETTLRLWAYENGKAQTPAVLVILSLRCLNFDILCDRLAERARPSFGAVRRLYTINGQLVHGMDTLPANKTVVMCGMVEFKPAQFVAGGQKGRSGFIPPVQRHLGPRHQRFSKLLPMAAFKVNDRQAFHEMDMPKPLIIYVMRNGDPWGVPKKILLSVGLDVDSWFHEITKELRLETFLKRLYTTSATVVRTKEDFIAGAYYTAVWKNEPLLLNSHQLPSYHEHASPGKELPRKLVLPHISDDPFGSFVPLSVSERKPLKPKATLLSFQGMANAIGARRIPAAATSPSPRASPLFSSSPVATLPIKHPAAQSPIISPAMSRKAQPIPQDLVLPMVAKKNVPRFDSVEEDFKDMVANPRRAHEIMALWNCMPHANATVSLADACSMVEDKYPVLDSETALHGAFVQTTNRDCHDDNAYVEEKEFSALLRNIIYFNKLYAVFDETVGKDIDRSLSLTEFKQGCLLLGKKMSDTQAKEVFESLHVGSKILFVQFCAWYAATECPLPGELQKQRQQNNQTHQYAPQHQKQKQKDKPAYEEPTRLQQHQQPQKSQVDLLTTDDPHRAELGGNLAAASSIMSDVIKSDRRKSSLGSGIMVVQGALRPKYLAESGMTTKRFDVVENDFRDLVSNVTRTNELRGLWERLDNNRNGIVSLAEIDKLVTERYPILNHKPALIRAYMLTTLKDGDGDSFVERHEFIALLRNIVYFNKMFFIFDEMEGGDDRRLTPAEFEESCSKFGLDVTAEDVKLAFTETGAIKYMLFTQFCMWVAKSHCPIDGIVQTEYVSAAEGIQHMKHNRLSTSNAKQTNTKRLAVYDALEKEFLSLLSKSHTAELQQLFNNLDKNNNELVSLAEIDLFVINKYPALNHKPALMQAYQQTTHRDGDGDAYVERPEFPALLRNIMYFNKLFYIFDQMDSEDKDRRLSLTEFQEGCQLLAIPISTSSSKQAFEDIAGDLDGKVLFGQFCVWAAEIMFPIR